MLLTSQRPAPQTRVSRSVRNSPTPQAQGPADLVPLYELTPSEQQTMIYGTFI